MISDGENCHQYQQSEQLPHLNSLTPPPSPRPKKKRRVVSKQNINNNFV